MSGAGTAPATTTTAPGGIRFGLSTPGYGELARLVTRARWAEAAGFSTFSVSDHLDAPSPFVTLGAAAVATEHIRLGTLVLNNDLRHPAVLARDAATLDRLSGGRLELGLGAGWAASEYLRAGLPYDPAGTRVDRLAETVAALHALWSGELVETHGEHVHLDGHFVVPRPDTGRGLPLLIGGNGDRVLRLAARQASIVAFTGFGPDRDGQNIRSHISRAGLADRVALVDRAAAHRDERPELNVLVQYLAVTDDREYVATTIARRWRTSLVEVLTCPFLAFGTVEEICLQLTRLRDDHGIGYVTVFDPHAEDAAKVIAALAGAAGTVEG